MSGMKQLNLAGLLIDADAIVLLFHSLKFWLAGSFESEVLDKPPALPTGMGPHQVVPVDGHIPDVYRPEVNPAERIPDEEVQSSSSDDNVSDVPWEDSQGRVDLAPVEEEVLHRELAAEHLASPVSLLQASTFECRVNPKRGWIARCAQHVSRLHVV